MIAIGMTGLFYSLALDYEGSAITNIIWIALSAILVTTMGYFIFKEHITGLQFMGILIVLIGVILINYR